jgi:hypothetical protein
MRKGEMVGTPRGRRHGPPRLAAAVEEESSSPYSSSLELDGLKVPSRRSRGRARTTKVGRPPAPPPQLDALPASGEEKEEAGY